MSESSQKKKGRIRAPRVHLEYEVETNGAMRMKELAFVGGVMADLAGHKTRDTKLSERKFVDIDRDNFDAVMKGIAPELSIKVDNKLSPEGGEMGVGLKFEKMDDFSPVNVANQVEPLKKLLEVRAQLVDLKNRADSSDRLAELLDEVLQNEDLRNQLKDRLSGGGGGGGDAPA
ncbi:MAG: type VI secretion system contractile sheath small subunit [Planctomycetota bacterium]